ncbi:DivIVA domain-containing protein [Persicobacter psychrovividus]|uniref:DivIVA domain-containing protein n=1 Tax=Persicobacter psychrovividus TaxID=387638 RepID=A0ABM7VBV1_9BACT|nr:hypothetical protein PEPS_06460 [Persicobacter psychrovividus]
MKVTPIEIRQKSFEKVFRGYDKEEVDAFLKSLSVQWEQMLDESKELKFRMEAAEKEVEKLREVESSLFKTLKTAEDTGANIKEQATKEAELILREAQNEAGQIIGKAQLEASKMVNDAEEHVANLDHELKQKTHQFKLNAEQELKNMQLNYAATDGMSEDLIAEIKANMEDLQIRVSKMEFKKRELRKKHEQVFANMHRLNSELIKNNDLREVITNVPEEEEKIIAEKPEQYGMPEIDSPEPAPDHQSVPPKKEATPPASDHSQEGSTSFFDQL